MFKGADKKRDGKGKATPDARKRPSAVSRFFSTPARILAPRLLLIASVVALLALGLVMVYSASSILALSSEEYGYNPMYFLQRQAIFVVAGGILCVALACLPYRFWANRAVAGAVWVIAVLMLAATAFGLGIDALGAARSIMIGPFALQPAEFAKIAVLIAVALILKLRVEGQIDDIPFLVVMIVCIAIPVFLIYRQPDLGTAIILVIGVLAIWMLSGLSIKVVFAIIALLLVYVAFVSIVQPYHIDRIMSAINPWADPTGDGYQVIQSLYAFGSGGVTGTGLGLSRQKYLYLPYAHTDFIYAIIGEELGLIGAAATLLLFGVFIFAGLRIARSAPDLFGSMLAGSMTVMIGFQACVNMACVTGIAPVTGKALPFLSYGGSSVVATLIMVGLILSVSLQSKVDAASERRRDDLRVLDGGPSTDSSGSRGSGKVIAFPGRKKKQEKKRSGRNGGTRAKSGSRSTSRSGSKKTGKR